MKSKRTCIRKNKKIVIDVALKSFKHLVEKELKKPQVL